MKGINGMQAPLISVIVPVYNVEDYLEQCLKSIRHQTLSQIEIIVIDDGSTDRSGIICDAFASEDSRFRIVHKENEGLAAARNEGLALASAEYIMFVDSDDWVEPEFCEVPYRIAQEIDADLVSFDIRVFNNKGKDMRWEPTPLTRIISTEEALTEYWPFVRVVVWNKLYRRSLFENIRYPEGHLSEDTAVTHWMIHRACRIFLLDKALYNYRSMRPGSITEKGTRQLLEDSARYNLQRLNDLRTWGYDCSEEEQKLAITYLAQQGRHQEQSPAFERILRECQHFTGNTSWRQKVMFRIFRISPLLFDLISVLTGRRLKEFRRTDTHRG